MFAVSSIHTANYQDLADITDPPKIEYCHRYNYLWLPLTETKYSPIIGFNKIHHTLAMFNEYPDIEWLLFCECDATITNLAISIEERIDNDYHFILPVDRLNLNSGNFLARNSEQGRAYLQMIIDREEAYKDVEWAEQQVIIDTIEEYQDIVKIVPQKYMNSYQQYAYDYCYVSPDVLGNSAEWEPGDWIVHWPGLLKPIRMHVAQEMISKIIR